jgi:hypothetical protein
VVGWLALPLMGYANQEKKFVKDKNNKSRQEKE